MNRVICLLLCLWTAVLLCACSRPSETAETAAGTETAETAAGTETTETAAGTETPDPDAEFYLADLNRLLKTPASPYAEHVYSHQGTGLEEASETFAAYDLAIAYGSRYLEQDLVVSADGVLYCSHDLSPKALTGETRTFAEMTSAELDALRTVDGTQRLLRLEDVFKRYGTAVTYVIELKAGGPTIEPFCTLVREYGMEEQIILQSSSLWYLEQVEKEFPEMPKLFLLFEPEKFKDALAAEYVDVIAGGSAFFNQESCDEVHAAGKKFCLYVCNRSSDIRRAIEMGVDCYFTDYTAKAFVLEALYR